MAIEDLSTTHHTIMYLSSKLSAIGYRLSAIIRITLQRLRSNGWLVGCALVALIAALALAVAVPVYAEAASLRLLNEELARQEARTARSAFALLIRALATSTSRLTVEQLPGADEAVQQALARVGLPTVGYAHHARTATMPVFENDADRPLLDIAFGYLSGMDEQLELVEGRLPQPAKALDQPMEVLISRALAERVGLNSGAELVAVGRASGQDISIPVRIVGLWQPRVPQHPAWFYSPDAFDELLLVPESSFDGPVARALNGTIAQAAWFARLDGSSLNAATASTLASQMNNLQATVAASLPGAQLEQSPASSLARYRSESATLALQLAIFGAPLFALLLAFLAMIGGLMLRRQEGEIALLKTRGIADWQVALLLALEWLLIGGLALLCGPPLGLLFAGLMARTSSFLQLDPALPALQLALTSQHLLVAAAALAVALLAVLWPALRAARKTLVDLQRQAARPEQAPFWRRRWLDLLLLPVPLYGLYQLRAGELFNPGNAPDLTANPLLVLVPALLSLSLSLLVLRLLSPLFGTAARLAAARSSGSVPLVALQALARQPEKYTTALLLLMLTLSTALFSTATAAALDDGLHRSVGYNVAADAQLLETGQSTEGLNSAGQLERRTISEEPRFLFVPVGDHLSVPGIEAASRVGRYSGQLTIGGNAQLVGIDRLTLPEVLHGFDPTWASGVSLGELMNRLATQPDGAIISSDLLARGFNVGDRLPVRVDMYGDRHEIELVIVGVVDLFPGLYPQQGSLVISQLDNLFDQVGGQYPYDVWVDLAPNADLAQVAAGVRALGIDLVEIRSATELTRSEQARPQRQGLFGLLSVGFLAAALLTIIGLLSTIVMNARQRLQELGVLRAIGMPQRAAMSTLLLEQLSIIGSGLLAGTAIGSSCALLVVPTIVTSGGPYPGTPPIAPRLPLEDMSLLVLALGTTLLLALVGLAFALRRMQLFTIVKMGDG
jgi:putative ABC transport system permease protein